MNDNTDTHAANAAAAADDSRPPVPAPAAETRAFQAEVRQVLDIVVHSLYKDRDIFIRELVSNASDALEKFRHIRLTEREALASSAADDSGEPLEISITTDEAAGTITIADNGVGLTREELVGNIGTIAHSGTKAFLAALREQGAGAANENLIGQFGVGFFSAFMVAGTVTIRTRSWRPGADALLWRSDGDGTYAIEPLPEGEGQGRGARITLHLKPGHKEFAAVDRIRGILRRYSAYIPHPIRLNGDIFQTVAPLWLKGKNEVTPEQYKEFYKFHCHAWDEPLDWLHFNADAPLLINALLYLPSTNTEKNGFGRMEAGVSLHCRKILIDAAPQNLLPEWCRFLRGVVDSADLPLNISRETLQDSAIIAKLRSLLVKRLIKFLEDLAKRDAARYEKFWREFSHHIKEGIVTDHAQREALASLLRYESSWEGEGSGAKEEPAAPDGAGEAKGEGDAAPATANGASKLTTLDAYVARMAPSQKDIYYLAGADRATLEQGPYLEAFRARHLEVLFLYDAADDYVMGHLGTYKDRKLVPADQADLDLGQLPDGAPKAAEPLPEARAAELCDWLKTELSSDTARKIEAVGTGQRLVDSPIVALNTDRHLSGSMLRLMRAMSKDGDAAAPLTPAVRLEINPRHPLIHRLDAIRGTDPGLARLVAAQLFDSALLAAGLLENPQAMTARIYQILERAAT
ncbi:MAG: molecular chaperone HtpG [Puniceicoccales bacterium]|jgi:molecular chaperone HtpG|nr:molecular chaperone HtpG [Puniceicoccales bacterium]